MSHNWMNVLVQPDSTIEDAIKAIDSESLRIALVVDNERRLLGTITDGDIRRALIRHIQLSDHVQEIMNRTPKTADVNTPKSTLLNMMEFDELLSIPILENGILVGLETLQNVLTQPKNDNPVFLMAGGAGTRLRPLTDNCPKPLLKIGGKPILETILKSFVDAGFHKFYISTHYMPEMIENYFGDGSKWGVEINYVHENTPLGTGGALGLLPKDLPDLPIIVMNGDVLTKVDFANLLNYHNDQNPSVTMCVQEYEYQIPYGVIQADEGKIIGMVEKPKQKFFVNAGIYVVSRHIIKKINGGEKVDMPTLLENEIKNGELVSMFPIHEYWLDIGKIHDFERAQEDFPQDFT